MNMAAILVMWPGLFEQTFVPPSHGDSIWNLASIGPVVSEEKCLECGWRTDDGWTDDGRRTPIYPISSPMSLWLRWAKNQCHGRTDWHENSIPNHKQSLRGYNNTIILVFYKKKIAQKLWEIGPFIIWALSRVKLFYAICEQQRCRSACAVWSAPLFFTA